MSFSQIRYMTSLVDHGYLAGHDGSIHPMDKTPVGKRLEYIQINGPFLPIYNILVKGSRDIYELLPYLEHEIFTLSTVITLDSNTFAHAFHT